MLKRESVEGKFYLQGVDAYVTFTRAENGDTNYSFNTGLSGTLPTVTRVKVREAMSKLLKVPVQPMYLPIQ